MRMHRAAESLGRHHTNHTRKSIGMQCKAHSKCARIGARSGLAAVAIASAQRGGKRACYMLQLSCRRRRLHVHKRDLSVGIGGAAAAAAVCFGPTASCEMPVVFSGVSLCPSREVTRTTTTPPPPPLPL